MKLKVSQLLLAQEVLNNLGDTQMSPISSYRIARNMKAIAAEVVTFDETRKALFEQYAKRDEHGKAIIKDDNTYDIDQEAMEKIASELQTVIDESIDVNITPIDVECLTGATITPKQMATIEFMISFSE